MEDLEYILEDISESRNYRYPTLLREFIEEHLIYCPREAKELVALERLFHCEINVNVEKHNELQYTYYYTITSELVEGELHLEIESGINNGTLILEASVSSSLKPKFRAVEVFKDIELDKERILRHTPNENLEKAQMMSDNHRAEIIKMHRNQSYDDYVTGGGTNKTDKYYKDFRDGLNNKGLYWQNIYEEVEADVNWQ